MYESQIPDKMLLKSVMQRIMRKGTSSSRISASATRGEITLTGTIKQEGDRRAILKACTTVTGVVRVIDQIEVEERKPRN